MPLITSVQPEGGAALEEVVAAILDECGMQVDRRVELTLPRGTVEVDVLASEDVDGIVTRIVCECKNWATNIPQNVVHGFRTVVQESGAHRGYIISRMGFQSGAVEAAESTNIELTTFNEFQTIFFDKWFSKRIWQMEKSVGSLNSYYEPFGGPPLSSFRNQAERDRYDEVFDKFAFAGHALWQFSPYLKQTSVAKLPAIPFDFSYIEKRGLTVPQDMKTIATYREFLDLLEKYCEAGLRELREVNPVTRN